jgi:recombination protein RecT
VTTALANSGAGAPLAHRPARQTVMDLVLAKKDAIAAVATKHLTAEKLIKCVGVAMARTPKLAQCTPMSLLNAVMTCAELGLTPNNGLGSVYLIPYGQECQLIIGYRGMCELARRSGQITTIEANVVRMGDEFKWEYGVETKFRHRPKGDSAGEITHAWALARFRQGGHQLVVLTRGEIDAIRRRSKASGSGPWVTDFGEMAKKTAVRRLCKMLPLTPDVEIAMQQADNKEFRFDVPELGVEGAEGAGDGDDGASFETAKGETQKLVDQLKAKREAASNAPPEEINTATGEVVIDRTEAQPDPLAGSTPITEPMPGSKPADPDGGMFDADRPAGRRRGNR